MHKSSSEITEIYGGFPLTSQGNGNTVYSSARYVWKWQRYFSLPSHDILCTIYPAFSAIYLFARLIYGFLAPSLPVNRFVSAIPQAYFFDGENDYIWIANYENIAQFFPTILAAW